MRKSVFLIIILLMKIRIFLYLLLSQNKERGQLKRVQAVQLVGSGYIQAGKNVSIGCFPSPYFFSTYAYLEARQVESRIAIGDGTQINNGFTAIAEKTSIIIGSNCLIGTNVEIYDSDFHPISNFDRSISSASHEAKAVLIGRNVFIGSNVKILKGVVIGDGSVIANGSIVTKNIPAECLAAGVPATVRRSLAPDPKNFGPLNVSNQPQSHRIGRGTLVWQYVVILPGAIIGSDCNICSHCFIENDVTIGDRVTIKNGSRLYDGLKIDDDVFIGPNVTFTNDNFPRSKKYPPSFPLTVVETGASIGGGATILPGVVIGQYAMIGAGTVLTKSVPPYSIVVGNPGRVVGVVKDAISEQRVSG